MNEEDNGVDFYSGRPDSNLTSPEDTWEPDINVSEGLEALYKRHLSIDTGDSLTRNYLRLKEADEITTGLLLTPESANEKYPNIPEKFKEAVPEDKAKFLDNFYKERRNLDDQVTAAFGDGFGKNVLDFGYGVASSLSDPVELSINIATGIGVGMIGRAALKSTSTSIAVRAAQKVAGFEVAGVKNVGLEVAENVAGSVLQEPINMAVKKDLHETYTLQDATMNVVMGSTAFTGLRIGATKVAGAVKGTYNKLKPKVLGQEIEENMGRMSNDLPPANYRQQQVTEELFYKREVNVPLDEKTTRYKFNEQFTPETQKTLYVAVDRNSDQQFVQLGENLPEDMITALDNANIMNSAADEVIEVDASKLKILDADDPIIMASESAEATQGIFVKILDSLDSKFKEDVDMSATFGDLVQKVREGIESGKYTDDDLLDLLNHVKDSGYDGFKLTSLETPEKYHGVHIFPDSITKLDYKKEFRANKEHRIDLSPKYAEMRKKEMEGKPVDFDSEAEAIIRENKNLRAEEPKEQLDKIDKDTKSKLDILNARNKADVLDQANKKKYETVDAKVKENETVLGRIKSFLVDCLGANVDG